MTLMTIIAAMFVAALAGVLYTIILKFKDDPNVTQPIDWASLASNVIVGAVIGAYAGYNGITVTIDWLGGQIAAYAVIIALLDHIIQGILNRTVRKPQFAMLHGKVFPKNPGVKTSLAQFLAGVVATLRKMDPESRNFLIFDLPDWAKQLTLSCVDLAEAKSLYQYAIQAANWVFLIEDGELTGAKHFWTFFGWFGAANVTWKPISPATLAAIRQTGKFPDYVNLV